MGPIRAVRIIGSSPSGGRGDTNSEKEGPAFRRSRKVVGDRRVVEEGGAVGSVGSETAVAKVRDLGRKGRIAHIGGVYRCRSDVALEAISR